MTDLISAFLTADPFSLRFPYIFRLLNFYFDTEYYAILMSNSFTNTFPYARTASTIPSFRFSFKTN